MNSFNTEKKAIDGEIVARAFGGGLLTAGGAFALMNAARHVAQQRRDAAKAREKTETDEGTIVLTLPRRVTKAAEDAVPSATAPTAITMPTSDELALTEGINQWKSKETGKFGPGYSNLTTDTKTAQKADWQTLTAAILAGLGGGAVGAYGVNKMYDKYREGRLKAKLDAAKQEYMDLLSGGEVKGASVIEHVLGCRDALDAVAAARDDGTKQAGRTFGMLDYPIGYAAAMTILGAGGMAYITKRVLDERKKEIENEGFKPPKIQRIVFRTEPEADLKKRATPADVESVKAGFAIMMDKVGCDTRFVGDPKVVAVMPSGETTDSLVKRANDWDSLMMYMSANPQLRMALAGTANQYLTKNPLMRTLNSVGMKLPFFGQKMVDNKLESFLSAMAPGKPNFRSVKTETIDPNYRGPAKLGAKWKYRPLPKIVRTIPDQPTIQTYDERAPLPDIMMPSGRYQKAAAGIGGLIGGAAGIDILSNDDLDPRDIAKAVLDEQERRAKAKENAGKMVPDEVMVEAADPEAAKYVSANAAKIRAVIARLAPEGQLG